MKRILALTFCLGLALTQVVHADNKDKNKKHAKKAVAAQEHNSVRAAKQNAQFQRNAKVQRNMQAHETRNAMRVQRQQAKVERNLQAQENANALRLQRQQARIQQNNAEIQTRQWNRANRNAVIANETNRAIARNNVVVRNRNSWYEARNSFNWHHHHDRSWWHSNYPSTRFVLFGGGYYFWNNGYWYPAYGYDRAYSTYAYDEPIYGYNHYEPGRVISDVQHQLRREGYYHGEIDGLIGPMTRHALARYQADHGLYVTRAIDEPTLEALGLV